jgi:hypothetical protein
VILCFNANFRSEDLANPVPILEPASGYVMIFRRPPDRGDRSIRYFPRASLRKRFKKCLKPVLSFVIGLGSPLTVRSVIPVAQ